MKVLVGCEFSQVVTKAFRDRGHEAYSCDLLQTEGNPDWHIQGDVFEAIKQVKPELGIFHPPCTNLSCSGAAHFKKKIADGSQQKSIEFFMTLTNTPIKRIAIENPVGIMSTIWREPDQIIEPYQFGHPVKKATCLWLKNLPKLKPTQIVAPEIVTLGNGKRFSKWDYEIACMKHSVRGHLRSKTFLGVAEAMAEQWGNYKEIQSELLIFNMSEKEGVKP